MTPRMIRTLSLAGFMLLSAFGSARAGQVVTKEAHDWAKRAIQGEKSLKGTPAKNTLAVLYFLNKTPDAQLDPLQKGMAIMLMTDLSAVKDLQVVERVRLQALLQEMRLAASGLVEPSTAPRVGRLLAAERVVGGEMAGEQKRLLVRSTLLDVPSSATVGRAASEGSLPELFRVEKDLLFRIVKMLKIKVTPEEKKQLEKPCSTNTAALMALFKGIDASDREQYEQAAALYKMALTEDPHVCIAEDALKELQDRGLVPMIGAGQATGGVAQEAAPEEAFGTEAAGEEEVESNEDMLQSLRDGTSLTNQLTPTTETRYPPSAADIPPSATIELVFPPTP